jgi:glucosyl-dolichyl phosphate glucuronosyltransferase
MIAPHLIRPWMTNAHRTMLFEIVSVTEDQRQNPFLIGSNMMFSRVVLEKVPRFDTALGPGGLGYMEDTLFCEQLKEAGFRIVFALDATVIHHFDASRLMRTSFLEAAKRHGKSTAYVVHHWSQDPPSFVRARLAKNRMRLAYLQATMRADCHRLEGVATWEVEYLIRASLYSSYLKIRNTPPNYAKRGLSIIPM